MDSVIHATGCLEQPPETRVGAQCGAYTGRSIPRSDWATTDALKRYVPRGKCQFTVPACNWYATLKAWQIKYALVTGKPAPDVSYCAGYQEDTGGNFNVGTMPLRSIRQIAERGIHLATPDLPEWFNRPRRVPADVAAARVELRADEWEQVQTADEIVSALLNNDPIDFGMDWWDPDANPGPTGELAVSHRGEPGGHALTGWGVLMGYRLSPSGVGIRFNNHHGDSKTPAQADERGRKILSGIWGNDGDGIVPIERVVAGARKYGAWALRTVTIRDIDLPDLTPKFQ